MIDRLHRVGYVARGIWITVRGGRVDIQTSDIRKLESLGFLNVEFRDGYMYGVPVV